MNTTQENGVPLDRWIEDQAGGDGGFYYWLYNVQTDAANFLHGVDDETSGCLDDRLPDDLRAALKVVAEYEVTVLR